MTPLSKSAIQALVSPQDQLLDTEQAAIYLGVKPSTLSNWRTTRRYNLPYLKIGRLTKYKRSELDKFITSKSVGFNPTEEEK